MSDSVLLEAREAELRRLRDGLDTIDWLLHEDRLSGSAQVASRLTPGERVKHDVVELVRAMLGDEWLDSRNIPRHTPADLPRAEGATQPLPVLERTLMGRPRLLDLFCGAGGCSVGYERAGFEVVGVDIASQPNYPFEFIQADALEVLDRLTYGLSLIDGVLRTGTTLRLEDFVAIHASPPCQHFTAYGRAVKDIKERYEDLVEPTRELLNETGLPWVMENVEGSPLIDPVVLCGSMFDLDVQRHRLFETNWPLQAPEWPCRHKIWGRRFKSSTGRKPNSRFTIEVGSWDEPLERQKAAMGVDWKITTRELSEAIPPSYTEFIGSQLLAHLSLEVAA